MTEILTVLLSNIETCTFSELMIEVDVGVRILLGSEEQGIKMQLEDTSSNLDKIFPESEDDLKDIYRIGDLAREFDVTLRTLRFYEARGLLIPQRSGSTRLYSQKDRARLKIILLAKRVGFSLIEIQELMNISDSDLPANEQLAHILEKFKKQVNVLKVQRVELDNSLKELEHTIALISALADQA